MLIVERVCDGFAYSGERLCRCREKNGRGAFLKDNFGNLRSLGREGRARRLLVLCKRDAIRSQWRLWSPLASSRIMANFAADG